MESAFQARQRLRFIDDLIPLILDGNDHWWPRDLRLLAQVSSAWLTHVRQRLYALPSLYDFRACTLLSRTLSENPAILSLIKGIKLQPLTATPLGIQCLDPEDSSSVRFLLGIEGLQHITLGGLLVIKAERFLHAVSDAYSVLSLHIDGREMRRYQPSLEWDESIATRFSSLQSLRLTSIELDVPHSPILYRLRLSDLQLDDVTVVNGYLVHLLNETPRLRRLCIRSAQASEFDEQVRLILNSCIIETLEFEDEADGHSYHFIYDSNHSMLSSLRSLRLTGLQVDAGFLEFVREKCESLEDFVIFGRMVTILPREWISFLAKGSLARLRRLGLPWGTRHPPFIRWRRSDSDLVVEAAALRNIHVVTD